MRGAFKVRRSYIVRLVRWREWYDSKIPIFLFCRFYAALERPWPPRALAGEMALLLLLLCAYAAFGHLANDLGDRAIDRAANKSNGLGAMEAGAARFVLMVAGVSLIAAILHYRHDLPVLILVLLSFACAAAYSLPPLRLKEHGTLGLIAVVAAERTLPTLVIFAALHTWTAAAVGLCALNTLIGLRYILVHQLDDLPNDTKTGTSTFGVRRGAAALGALLYRGLFPLELIGIAAMIAVMSAELPEIGVMVLAFALWTPASLKVSEERLRAEPRTGYYWFGELYFVVWPVLLAVLLAVRYPLFIPLPLLTLWWQRRMLSHVLKEWREPARLGEGATSSSA